MTMCIDLEVVPYWFLQTYKGSKEVFIFICVRLNILDNSHYNCVYIHLNQSSILTISTQSSHNIILKKIKPKSHYSYLAFDDQVILRMVMVFSTT